MGALASVSRGSVLIERFSAIALHYKRPAHSIIARHGSSASPAASLKRSILRTLNLVAMAEGAPGGRSGP